MDGSIRQRSMPSDWSIFVTHSACFGGLRLADAMDSPASIDIDPSATGRPIWILEPESMESMESNCLTWASAVDD